AGRAGVVVDLIGVAIHQPDVGAVGGDAGERRRGTQAAGRPGAEQGAAGAADVDVFISIHDPFGGAGGSGRHAARGGVAAGQGVVAQRGSAGGVLVGLVGA